MKASKKHLQELYELFASVRTEKESKMLLSDILTPSEIDSIAERWQLVQKLAEGEPQRKIAEYLGISICKITKGSRVIQYGSGGLQYFLKKLGKLKKK